MQLRTLLASIEDEDDRSRYSDEQFDVALLLSELGQGNQVAQLAQLVQDIDSKTVCAEKALHDSSGPSQGSGMTDRHKKQSSVESQELHVWTDLGTKLSGLNDIQAKVAEATHLANTLQKEWDDLQETLTQQNDAEQIDDDQEDERNNLRDRLLRALDTLDEQSGQEKALASEALESLGILVALRTPAEQLQVPIELNKRKKRRLDASPAPSDISSARASPAPGGPPTPSLDKVSRSLSRSLSINTTTRDGSSAHPEPTPSTAPSQPPNTARGMKNQAPATMTKKERREALLAQLPLKEGRPVAFKPPVKGLGKGSKMEPGSTDWIWAKVVRCISGDKNRYEVQDVQDAEGYEGKPGASYNTTLKAILALPDARDRSTYPPAPYPVGTEVMALYPETTSFYKARVVAQPGQGKRQAQNYKLIFDDDNEEVKTVSIDFVVDLPEK